MHFDMDSSFFIWYHTNIQTFSILYWMHIDMVSNYDIIILKLYDINSICNVGNFYSGYCIFEYFRCAVNTKIKKVPKKQCFNMQQKSLLKNVKYWIKHLDYIWTIEISSEASEVLLKHSKHFGSIQNESGVRKIL